MAILNGVEYNLKDPDQKKEYMRLYSRAYNAKNREQIRETQNKWRMVNRERINQYQREYREKLNDETKAKYRKKAVERAWIRYNYDDEYREAKKKYMNNKYATDPVYRQKRIEYFKRRYKTDEEFKTKCLLYQTLARQCLSLMFVSVYAMNFLAVGKKQNELKLSVAS